MKQSSQAIEPRVVPAHPRPEVDQPLLSWQAPEYSFHKKGNSWFLVAGLAAVSLFAGALLFREWLMAVVVVVLSLVVYQHANRSPRELSYTITKLGVQVGERLYPYNELKSFWVIHQPVQTLNLLPVKRLAPPLVIQLEGVDPVSVRDVLSQHLPEEEKRQEDWIDRLARIARF